MTTRNQDAARERAFRTGTLPEADRRAPEADAGELEDGVVTVVDRAALFNKLSALPAGSSIHFDASNEVAGQVNVQIRKKTEGAHLMYADGMSLILAAEQLPPRGD